MKLQTLEPVSQLHVPLSLEQEAALTALKIYSIRDLAEYTPARYAESLMNYRANNNLDAIPLDTYLNKAVIQPNLAVVLPNLDIVQLKIIGEVTAKHLKKGFNIHTIQQLSEWPLFRKARMDFHQEIVEEAFQELPSAPEDLMPKLIGSTYTAARFSSFVKGKIREFDSQSLTVIKRYDNTHALVHLFTREPLQYYLGYVAGIRQKWVNDGTHLGEIIHSIALAPGESRNLAFIDWYQRQTSSRTEDTDATEIFQNQFLQTRALNEVVTATASEHLEGNTTVDSRTKNTGSGLAYGAGAALGVPIKGAILGVGSSLGSSTIISSNSVQGTLQSVTTGDREMMAEVVQNISDSTVQNASNVRSLMSTVVVEDQQSGSQTAETRNITNYNHSHALTMQYYEVLQKYNIVTQIDTIRPLLFLPFQPLHFSISTIQAYWTILGRRVRNQYPQRFKRMKEVLKSITPFQEAFDPDGQHSIQAIKITRGYQLSEKFEVVVDANPDVRIVINKRDLNNFMRLAVRGTNNILKYNVLSSSNTTRSLSTAEVRQIDLAGSYYLELSDTFKNDLKKELRRQIDAGNFEQLNPGISNRSKLKEKVNDDQYELENPQGTLSLDIKIEITVADQQSNRVTLSRELGASYNYAALNNGIGKDDLINFTQATREDIAQLEDINPVQDIDDIEDFFHQHRYEFTRFLLNNIEKEQLIDVVQNLKVLAKDWEMPLVQLVNPAPLAMTENLLVFELYQPSEEKKANATQGKARSSANNLGILQSIRRHFAELGKLESEMRQRGKQETVFLPTAGVFGEAILGRSNASEFIDMRRFYNWQDSPIPHHSPAIDAININQSFAQPVADGLDPNIPDSTIEQMQPQQLPVPNLAAMIQAIQNGNMFRDMSKTDQFMSILGELAKLAGTTAQAAGNLAGEAGKDALAAAVAMGQSVMGMAGKGLDLSDSAPPSNVTEKGGAHNIGETIKENQNGPLTPIEQGQLENAGIPISRPGNGIGGGSDNTGGNGTPINPGQPGGQPGGSEPQTGGDALSDPNLLAGAVRFRVALPGSTQYTSLNLLEIAENFIPNSMEAAFREMMDQFYQLATAEGSNDGFTLIPFVLKIPEISGKVKGVEFGIQLEDDNHMNAMINQSYLLTQAMNNLLLEMMYHFAHTKVKIENQTNAAPNGTLLQATLNVRKQKGKVVETEVKDIVYGSISYWIGGDMIGMDSTSLNAEGLHGGLRLANHGTAGALINTQFSDLGNGTGFKLIFEGTHQIIPHLNHLVAYYQQWYAAEIERIINQDFGEAECIEQLLDIFQAVIDRFDLLEELLRYMGLSEATIETIMTGVEAAQNAGDAVLDYLSSVLNLLFQTGLVSAKSLMAKFFKLFFDLTFLPFSILDAHWQYQARVEVEIDYFGGLTPGWRTSTQGSIREFPWVELQFLNGSEQRTIYEFHETYPQGLLGLNADRAIQQQLPTEL